MLLHDPHMNPEPILVISGLSYLIPTWAAYSRRRWYDAGTFLILTCTTVGFHGTRSETWFFLDCLAILNFMCLSAVRYRTWINWMAIMYSLISYFVGQRFLIMSFHPDWNTQMFFHSLMHLTTAASAYLSVCKADKICNID